MHNWQQLLVPSRHTPQDELLPQCWRPLPLNNADGYLKKPLEVPILQRPEALQRRERCFLHGRNVVAER